MQRHALVIRKRVFNGIDVTPIVIQLIDGGSLPHISHLIEQSVTNHKGLSARESSIQEAGALMALKTPATLSLGLAFDHVNSTDSSPWVNAGYATLRKEGNFFQGVITRGFPYKKPVVIEKTHISDIVRAILTEDFFNV